MVSSFKVTKTLSLDDIGITDAQVKYQLSPKELHDLSLAQNLGQSTKMGALAINTGDFTGRSPKDRFIVKDKITADEVWWGNVNIPFDSDQFDKLELKMKDYLSKKTLYVRDCFTCAEESYRIPLRVITELPWSSLFTYNMFIRPTEFELIDFSPEWIVLNAPGFLADPKIDGTRQSNFAILNFSKKMILVGGTGYTGEIKKGIFSAMNFILPVNRNTLPMHCSANVGSDGQTAIFFGLSGTGKTTLSAVPDRKLIGDDEHGWTPHDSVFNMEGGCYAKVINLTEESEPDIFRAIRSGALLENVIVDVNGVVDFTNSSITPNTRVSYPINFIDNIQEPSIGYNPKHIFFLTADAFGVLPPISKLSPDQAAYHFISGYTAKVAGTEEGVVEPVPNFSACFGAPFMPLHPTRYAEMLSQKMHDSKVNVWLINTGWTGGPYGTGSRMKLKYTRAMINAALDHQLDDVAYSKHPVFGLNIPQECPGVPSNILDPKNTWSDPLAYDEKAIYLSKIFNENFKQFEANATEGIKSGGPLL